MGAMKHYAIENNARVKAIAVIAMIALVLAVVLFDPTNKLISAAASAPSFAWLEHAGLINALEPMVFFALIWALFDNVIWRIPPLKHWHHIPYVGGTWVGELKSSHEDDDGNRVVMPMRMDIKQTFSKMSVHCSFEESSESYAVIAGIVDCDEANDECTLEFSYRNKAIDESVVFDTDRDSSYSGFNTLRLIADKATGDYVTLRNVPTSGHIKLERVQ